jgi:Tropinone reductase 1
MNWDLKGKITLVTGGTKVIGLAITNEFIELGAEVIVVARNTSSVSKSGKVCSL